jgi:flagellar motor component MotA
VNFLFSILIKETRALKSLIHSSTYNLQNDTHTFVSVVQIVKVLFEKNKTNLKPDSYDYLTSLYSYIFMVAKQGMWPKDALSCQLNLSEKKVRTAFACLYDKSVSDAITPEKSRAVIYKKMTELGFTLN